MLVPAEHADVHDLEGLVVRARQQLLAVGRIARERRVLLALRRADVLEAADLAGDDRLGLLSPLPDLRTAPSQVFERGWDAQVEAREKRGRLQRALGEDETRRKLLHRSGKIKLKINYIYFIFYNIFLFILKNI